MMMRSVVLVALAAAFLVAAGAHAGQIEAEVDTALAVVKRFATELQGELKGALQEDGPAHGVGVCKEKAPAIAARLSAKQHWQISRTSLKVRNPANAPDAWERQVLQAFERRRDAGEDVAALEYAEIVKSPGGKELRFMKAIPTAGLCLACHGENLAEDVAGRLRDLYPQDRATGFEAGDIRGAFTLRKSLK